MPSDQSTWLIAIPQDGDAEGLYEELSAKLSNSKAATASLAPLPVPSFKTGTLESLISLSEELPKHDAFFTATVAKTVDTLRNLLNNDPAKLAQHVRVNEQPVDAYLLRGWRWNEGRYGVERALRDMVDVLNKEMTSIDNVMKNKLNNYNLAKGSLVQMQRKKTGNMSVRSLADIVRKEHFIQDSEYLETLLIAVPKNLVKDWNAKYERLTPMVVPRSSTPIAADDEYALFAVVIFKKVHDEFLQKCRDNKYIVRDFTYSEDLLGKQREELALADTAEKELWVSRPPLLSLCLPADRRPAVPFPHSPNISADAARADGAAAARAHQLLRGVPDPRAPQGAAPVRRERAAVRPARGLRRAARQARAQGDEAHARDAADAVRVPRAAGEPAHGEDAGGRRRGRVRGRVPGAAGAGVLRLCAVRGAVDRAVAAPSGGLLGVHVFRASRSRTFCASCVVGAAGCEDDGVAVIAVSNMLPTWEIYDTMQIVYTRAEQSRCRRRCTHRDARERLQ